MEPWVQPHTGGAVPPALEVSRGVGCVEARPAALLGGRPGCPEARQVIAIVRMVGCRLMVDG